MERHFEPVRMERQAEYAERFSLTPQKASDYSFVNLWGWAEVHGLSWAWERDVVWIKQTIPEELYWAPVGNWEKMDWEKWFGEDRDKRFTVTRIPEKLAGIWENHFGPRMILSEVRGHWDYLYDVEALIELPGNRFHKKKNLLNQFRKNYEYIFVPLGLETIEKAVAMQEDWCTWRDCESSDALSAENNAISRVLNKWQELSGLLGGAIMVEDQMVAYTVGEKLEDGTLLIHFEKGNPEYKGVYQAINSLFLEYLNQHEAPHRSFHWVNREQDLDDDGLRKAKLSYHPSGFVKKFSMRMP